MTATFGEENADAALGDALQWICTALTGLSHGLVGFMKTILTFPRDSAKSNERKGLKDIDKSTGSNVSRQNPCSYHLTMVPLSCPEPYPSQSRPLVDTASTGLAAGLCLHSCSSPDSGKNEIVPNSDSTWKAHGWRRP